VKSLRSARIFSMSSSIVTKHPSPARPHAIVFAFDTTGL
jgi:hypothetical protein